MIEVELTADFNSKIERVFEVMTDNNNYAWRSDLSKIESDDDGLKFVEYDNNGFKTEFTITEKLPCQRYEFELRNKNMSGTWRGVFTETKEGTRVSLTEKLNVPNLFMRLFAKGYLKKQQARYIKDLKRELHE